MGGRGSSSMAAASSSAATGSTKNRDIDMSVVPKDWGKGVVGAETRYGNMISFPSAKVDLTNSRGNGLDQFGNKSRVQAEAEKKFGKSESYSQNPNGKVVQVDTDKHTVTVGGHYSNSPTATYKYKITGKGVTTSAEVSRRSGKLWPEVSTSSQGRAATYDKVEYKFTKVK